MDANTIILVAGAVSLLTLVILVIAITKILALSKNIVRLSEQIPGTGMTAKELAAELGGSIESSFQKFMPQPDKVSAAITSSVEASLKTASAGIEGVHKKLMDGQDAVLDKWVAHEKNSAAGLENIRKALDAASQQLTSGLTGGSQKMQASLDEGAKKVADTFSASSAKLEAALQDHAQKTTKAAELLSAQLEKIATLEKEIDKLLKLQQATEGTIKSVSSSEEFRNLVKELRTHLEASDTVLREIAKPRTIRLVEQEA
ncbi:MAG TPA: hypothetical protein PJ991_12295 [Kiritimatiellia bacterium]|nr:hypothetical protein [Kiritimatiellia bacterium]